MELGSPLDARRLRALDNGHYLGARPAARSADLDWRRNCTVSNPAPEGSLGTTEEPGRLGISNKNFVSV
jgi:hypothetical protein